MKCSHCDFELADSAKFCPNCGTPIQLLHPEAEPILEPVEDFAPPEVPPAEPENLFGEPEPAPDKQTPEPAGRSVPPPFPAEPTPSGNKFPIWVLGLGGVLILAVLVVAVILLSNLVGGGSSGNSVLIGVPDRSDNIEIYALKLGQELKDAEPMLEDGNFDSGYIYQVTSDDSYHLLGTWEYSAGFVKDSKYLGIGYSEDEDRSLYLTPPNPKELNAIFESEDDYYSIILDKGKTIFIQEDRGGSIRCYISQNGQEAEQVARGDGCSLAVFGQRVLVSDISSKDELTLKSYDFKGENEVVLLDDEPNIRNTSFQYNMEGTLLAVIVEDGDEAKVRLINLKNAEVIAESNLFVDILNIGISFRGDGVYFMAENQDGVLELYTFESKAQKLVATGTGLQAQFDQTGKNLVYLVSDEDNQQTIHVHSLNGKEDVEVMSGENLSFDLLQDKDILLVKEEDLDNGDVTLSSAKADGSALVEIFSDSDVTLNNIYTLADSDRLLIEVANQDGLFNIFSTQFGSAEGQYVLEDWAEVSFINGNAKGTSLLMYGAEERGDDELIFLLDLTGKNELVELDDDDIQRVVSAVFSPNGKEIVYTVQTGDNYDDYEVRQVAISGEDDYEVLYKEAILIDAAWANLDPFDTIWFSSPTYSSNACPGATTLALDVKVTDRLTSDLGETCFRFKAQAETDYTFYAIGQDEQDLSFELVDMDGYYLSSDDDSGPGSNPSLYWTNDTETQTVYLKVAGSTSDTPDFDLTVTEGRYDPAFAAAVRISTDGSPVSGTVETADTVDLSAFSGAGDLFYFDGKQGQTITLKVIVSGTSSSMDPLVALIEANQNLLNYDDDGGTDNDALLEYELPSDGRYYVLVIDNNEAPGPDCTYTIQASLGN